MNNFLVELDLLSIKDNPQHNGKLKESKNCKLSVQKTRLLKSPQRLCSFKTNTKIYRYRFNAWAIQAWYKNIKNLYIKLNMYKRKKKIMWLANNQNLRTLFWPVIHCSMCTCTSITYYDTLPFLGWKVQKSHKFYTEGFSECRSMLTFRSQNK